MPSFLGNLDDQNESKKMAVKKSHFSIVSETFVVCLDESEQ